MSAAGWYPDPSGAPGERYFNGKQWTDYHRNGPPPRKSHTGRNLLIGISCVLLLAIGGVALIAATDGQSSQEPELEASGSSGSRSARDGKFEFSITSVTTSDAGRLGLPAPRGTWVIAQVRVVNIGKEPQSFFVGNQRLIDTGGREYAADDMAAIRINEDAMVLDLGPGFSISVQIPFDIPPGATAQALELHDSAFSNGVRIDIS